MIYVPYEVAENTERSKYALVMILSKRARQIVEGAEPKIETNLKNPVSIAIEEYIENKIDFNEEGKEYPEIENLKDEIKQDEKDISEEEYV